VVYLNAAVVPRRKEMENSIVASHFLVVTLKDGVVTEAENVWVGGSGAQDLSVVESESLLRSRMTDGGLARSVYRAFHKDWREVVTPLRPGALKGLKSDHSEL